MQNGLLKCGKVHKGALAHLFAFVHLGAPRLPFWPGGNWRKSRLWGPKKYLFISLLICFFCLPNSISFAFACCHFLSLQKTLFRFFSCLLLTCTCKCQFFFCWELFRNIFLFLTVFVPLLILKFIKSANSFRELQVLPISSFSRGVDTPRACMHFGVYRHRCGGRVFQVYIQHEYLHTSTAVDKYNVTFICICLYFLI